MTTNSLTERKGFKLILWKSYFDKGYGLTNYFKYFIVLFGWGTGNVNNTIVIILFYLIGCLVLGKVWFHYRIIDLEMEVGNIYNPLARELRVDMKKRNI